MKLFNCNVRLGGNVLHDVPKYGVSEMEIRILQSIHGDDSVFRIKSAGDVKRTTKEEAAFLSESYGAKRVSDVTGISDVAPLVVDEEEETNDLDLTAAASGAGNAGNADTDAAEGKNEAKTTKAAQKAIE